MVPRQPTGFKLPYYCQQFECDGVFETEAQLLAHNLTGDHSKIEVFSSKDCIQAAYRQVATKDFQRYIPSQPQPSTSQVCEIPKDFFKVGWALPNRRSGRLDKSVKQFCIELFLEGEKSGRKLTAEQINQMMRKATMDDGTTKKFTSAQFMTTKQIASLMSRLSSTKAVKNVKNVNDLIDILPQVIIKYLLGYFLF